MKKILAGILFLIFLGWVVLKALEIVVSVLPDPCGEEVITEVVSPQQTMKVVIFERNCGATTDFTTHAAILKVNDTLTEKVRSVFAADSDHGSAPIGAGGGPEIRVRWLSENKVEIQYPMFARLIRAEAQAGDVEIVYTKFQ